MKELKTSIEINASPSAIWRVLVDFENYSQWNPFIMSIRGIPEPGEKIVAQIHPPGQRAMTIKPILLKVEENKEIRWLGHMMFPGIFDGEHVFIIESSKDTKSVFRHEEKFSGVFVPIFWKLLYQHTRAGFLKNESGLEKES